MDWITFFKVVGCVYAAYFFITIALDLLKGKSSTAVVNDNTYSAKDLMVEEEEVVSVVEEVTPKKKVMAES
ncbi:MAG: hypothetical protein AAF039_19035 [Bacteroidota bacterium]